MSIDAWDNSDSESESPSQTFLSCTFFPFVFSGQYDRVETAPGLDHFVSSLPLIASQSLGPLLVWAAAVIPFREREKVPIFLMASAGEGDLKHIRLNQG